MRKRGTVEIPSNGMKRLRVRYIRQGKEQVIEVEVPDTAESEELQIQEAAHFVQTLEDNHQLVEGNGPLPPGATHRIKMDTDGTKRLVRDRFNLV